MKSEKKVAQNDQYSLFQGELYVKKESPVKSYEVSPQDIQKGMSLWKIVEKRLCENCTGTKVQSTIDEILTLPENSFLLAPKRDNGHWIYPGEVITLPDGRFMNHGGIVFEKVNQDLYEKNYYTPSLRVKNQGLQPVDHDESAFDDDDDVTILSPSESSETGFWDGVWFLLKWALWIALAILALAGLYWLLRHFFGGNQNEPVERTLNVNYTFEDLTLEDEWTPEDPSAIINAIGEHQLNVDELDYDGDTGSLNLKGVTSPLNPLFKGEDIVRIFVFDEDSDEEK